ncbi:MAG: HD domain-containing protein [Candidatus Thermoplasmatota archaeon]
MEEKICKFIFELGQLRRVQREGWKLCGIKKPESVAEHSLRAAQIGYLLASMEEYKHPEEVCTILVFHDIGECRIGDIHKVANRYIKSGEEKAVKEQLEPLEISDEILSLWKKCEYKRNTAGVIAKDADLLDMAATAKEYIEQGFTSARDWFDKTSKRIQTESGKLLFKKLKDMSSVEWWKDLKKI